MMNKANKTHAKNTAARISFCKQNQVTLKMDIPYTEHSNIIGKGGVRIQNIMKETECHIHFPDSNRTNMTEKNNWVAITGQPSGVERARCRLRSLLPIVVTFELPAYYQFPPEPSNPVVKLIFQKYGFTAKFHQQNERIFVTARGVQNQFARFQKGLHVLMDYLTLKIDLPVTLKTDIGLINHQAVMGPANMNIEQIKRSCNVNIVFESVIPTTDSSQLRSGVYISGAFNDVYKAWKQLTDYLPLKLSFDLKEGQDILPGQITDMMSAFNVNIMTRLKKKENVKIITVQGVESESIILFKVRREVLNLDISEVPVCCDELDSYFSNENLPSSFAYLQSNPIQNEFSNFSNPFFISYIWSPEANASSSSWPAVEE